MLFMSSENSSHINVETFNKDNVINQLSSQGLEKLALLASNAIQLNKVAHAKNINSKVVTAIIANVKVKLHELDEESLLNLAKLSASSAELCKIVRAVDA